MFKRLFRYWSWAKMFGLAAVICYVLAALTKYNGLAAAGGVFILAAIICWTFID